MLSYVVIKPIKYLKWNCSMCIAHCATTLQTDATNLDFNITYYKCN